MTTTAVRVALRVRPLLNDDDEQQQQSIISFAQDAPQIYIDNKSFTFDSVYNPQSTQDQVYHSSVLPLLDHYIEGKNVTILAYGQTGSGKTYSMGTGLESSYAVDQGMIQRFANSLFDRIIEDSGKSLGKKSFQVYVSFLEVYNEDIIDLLAPTNPSESYHHPYSMSTSTMGSTSSEHHSIRQDGQRNIHWTGIKEERVEYVTDLLGLLKKGSQRRATDSTETHAIFSVILKQQITNDEDEDDIFNIGSAENAMLDLEYLPTTAFDNTQQQNLVSKFHFVDLAGSERLKRTNALDDRQKEEGINDGLLALGNVLSALGDKSQRVPYRDSILTRLLQDSLVGNSHTLMLACVSPCSSDYTETLNVLHYANCARGNIQNRVKEEINLNESPEEEEIHDLRTQISRLKIQVAMLRDNGGLENEIKVMREEKNSMKAFSQHIVNELAQAQSERDTLRLKLEQDKGKEQAIQSHPLIQQYAQELSTLKLQVAETQSKLDAVAARNNNNHVLNTTYDPPSISIHPFDDDDREHRTRSKSGPRVSSSMGYLSDKHLFVDPQHHHHHHHAKKFPNHLSASSSRKLNTSTTKKKPIIHRMKKSHSTSLSKKKSQQQQQKPHHYQNMDELLDLLRKEYLLEEQENRYKTSCSFVDEEEDVVGTTRENIEKSTADETSLHGSHGDNTMMTTMHHDNKGEEEAEFNNILAFSNNQNFKKNMMPLTPPTSNSLALDEDELETLSVPSWSDAAPTTKSQSIHGNSDASAKRKSISLDSMWDDTDSSITTSRGGVASTTTTSKNWNGTTGNKTSHHHSSNNNNSTSKDMKRQSRNLLKMLHQIQADLLVKRELVGQLEKSEDQYTQMRVNYEERLNELKDHLLEIQKQRDAALKGSGGAATIIPSPTTPIVTTPTTMSRPQSALQLRENRQAQEVRSQYEVKLKRLISENQELRKKNAQSTETMQTARAKAEGIIGRLRADVGVLKMDKKQLVKSLKLESDKAREAVANYEREIQHLKRREANALEAKKKLEVTNEATSQVLKKRTEEAAAVNLQIRQLTNVLRRAANEGTFLNEVTLEKLLDEAAISGGSNAVASQKSIRRRSTIGTAAISGGGVKLINGGTGGRDSPAPSPLG